MALNLRLHLYCKSKHSGHMPKKLFILLFLSVLKFAVFAQLLNAEKSKFTRADTLRGSLRPERNCIDVSYYDLNLSIDVTDHSIKGYNDIWFKARGDFQRLQIDLFANMIIDSIMHGDAVLTYTREFNAVFVTLDKKIKDDSHDKIRVYYHGRPTIAKKAPWDGGFVWNEDKDGKTWLGVACEGLGASMWWPNKDHLSDEPDSMMVTCTIPQDLQYIGNGRMVADTPGPNGTHTQSWKVSYPINNYDITLNIANYVHFSDSYYSKELGKSLDLDYYVLPYNLEKAKKQFKIVKPMMAIYEKYLGPYPFWNDGYALVETPYLGMEHQGAIAYGNGYQSGYAGKDYSGIGLDFDYIIVHESGHEWWGNSVSCKDIADMWIHESFCTYTEALFVEGMYGKKKAQEYLYAKQNHIGNKKPIVGTYGVNSEGDGDMYNKGALFLNTLRTITDNDSLWFGMIKEMASKQFYHKNVSYDDVVQFFSNRMHKNMKPIFDQYLKYPEIPTLLYRFEDKNKYMKTLYYKWKCDAPNFVMKMDYSLNGKKDYEYVSDQWRSADVRVRTIKKFELDTKKFYIKIQKF